MATVSEGRTEVAELIIAGVSGTEFDSIAIGSNGTATSDSMTSIQTEVDSATSLTGTVSGETASISNTFENNSATIEEVSLFESTNNVMLARQTISPVTLQSSDTLEITYEIDVQDV